MNQLEAVSKRPWFGPNALARKSSFHFKKSGTPGFVRAEVEG
jgi:hypothetical protein